MAVAEKTFAEERVPHSPNYQLAVGSLLGAIYVLFSLGLLFTGIPWLWGEYVPLKNEFLSSALLQQVLVLVAVGLFFLGRRLEKGHAARGLRAGVFVTCLFFAFLVLVGKGVGAGLEELGGFGALLTSVVLGGVVFAAIKLCFRPSFVQWLGEFEDGGWLHATSYKPNQGVRVRRGTFIALLTLGICGIITLVSHKALGTEYRLGEDKVIPNNWELTVPFWKAFFGEDVFDTITLLYKVHYTVPLILVGLLIWFSLRIVNWPAFTDFLIATEAEMNKVSWTTRKRLVQDTIVVLVTVFLLTAFLFMCDFLWVRVLSAPWVKVLLYDPAEARQKQQEKTQW